MYLIKMNLHYTLILIFTIFIITKEINGEDLYKLLDVPKDATLREIRRAFKNLAIKMHPDKNMDDENAHDKFIKITQAYETLKDPETRKTYDIYGESETMKGSTPQYHSYSYYTDEFGIYDDDLLIVTLSKADYELNILDNNKAWFINFYSPHCHHCHTLAPAWRKLAVELEGIVRLGAVNCEEDWVLCRQLNINAYPTLLYYEKEAHLYEGEQYRAPKRLEDLKDFVLSKLTISERYISDSDWNKKDLKNNEWLLFLCPDDLPLCPEKETRLKVTATLEGLLSVGYITDRELAGEISSGYRQNPVVFWTKESHVISGSDSKEIVDGVLDLLPNPELLDENKFKDIRTQLRTGSSKPWLICFYMGTATELNLQLKRLPTMISNTNIGLVHCGKSSGLCASIHISHYPTWGVVKEGGAFELHHGRDILHEVAAFARDSIKSTNLHALSPADFINIKSEGETWFIDWYAPWCPPCRKLMPEMRKASQRFTPNNIQFGTVDCTLHSKLCAQEDIRSYPTTIYYNGTSTQHLYHGVQNEEGIVEFVSDMLNPAVISLDESNFIQLMRKPENELWIVDYFAPWCGPCQRLAPEWRRLAKQMKDLSNVKVSQVDCVANSELCNAQHITGYPTIRLYPLGSKGLNTVALYNGHREVLALKSWIFSFLPSLVKSLVKADFKSKILNRTPEKPWLVDFYAPWCGHCVNFEPEFRIVAEMLEDKVNVGKLDCEAERDFCRQLRVVSYPTVILYLTGDNYYHISSQVPDEIVEKVGHLIDTNKRFLHDEF